MPTTTNYGWTTPADTDLVKDGASAIRTLGTAIDTTVYNNANAAIAKTIVDAKGDIIAATSADTVARLAVGSNNQVLTADSSTATGLKWANPSAGAAVLISRTAISAAATTTIDSLFSDTYENYIIDFYWVGSAGGINARINFRYSTTTHSANYKYCFNGLTESGSGSTFYGDNLTYFELPTVSSGSQNALNLNVTRLSGSNRLFMTGGLVNPYNAAGYSGTMFINSAQIWTGLEITTSSGTLTGAISIYGLVKA